MEVLTNSRISRDLPDFNSARRFEFAEPAHWAKEHFAQSRAVKAKKEPLRIRTFEFAQRLIPIEGGRQCIRLLKPLTLVVQDESTFVVRDWGIELPYVDLPRLPREVGRRFLFLLNAAQNCSLAENDEADWLRVSDYIDFRQFSVDRSSPRYQEGILRSSKETIIVEWHDGTRETLLRPAARSLSEVNVGERFSAFVKLGKNNETLHIERVLILGRADESTEEVWSDWPPKA